MSKTERLAHVQAWRGSGLSRPAYCRKYGLKYGTFMSWFKLEQNSNEQASGKFVALSAGPGASQPIEIIFPNGICVYYRGALNQALIQSLQDA